MKTFRLLLLCAPLCLAARGAAQKTIRLSGVPESLRYPFAPGTNLVLRASLPGDKVPACWLATSDEAKARLALAADDDGRYRVNLASDEVARFLREAGRSGSFHVYARLPSGELCESIALRYAFVSALRERPVLILRGKKSVHRVSPRRFAARWIDLDAIDEIEAEGAGDVELEASVGGESWRFSPTLELTAERKKAWEAHGDLEIAVPGGKRSWRFPTLRARPTRLRLAEARTQLTIVQRRRTTLPGSRGFLELAIDDITGGQVLVRVTAADGSVVVPQVSMRQGTEAAFKLGKRTYFLHLDKLVNLLIGDDRAVFSLRAERDLELRKVELLLEAIGKAKIRFLREGKEYSPAEAEAHLRAKLARFGLAVGDAKAFVETVASKSLTTGNPYRIQLPDGRVEPALGWMNARLARIAARIADQAKRKTP